MSALNVTARATIRSATCDVPGASTVGYIRHINGGDSTWRGDACGCSDDRCIGYHHNVGASACDCLRTLLDEYVCGCRGHVWSDDVREADYGRGRVRWRLCTHCTAVDYLGDRRRPSASA